MQPGPGRDQALLDAQLYGGLAASGSQTPSPAHSAPSEAPAANPSILPLPSLSPPTPPPPPQDLAGGPSFIPPPPPTPPQLAVEPETEPATAVGALLEVCPYKLESHSCPHGIRCTMRTPYNVCYINFLSPPPSSY